MTIILVNPINCSAYYQSPWLHLFSVFESFSWLKWHFETKKLSRNERELNATGTVDGVLSHQFLCTLCIKFPKTGYNIFNIAACTLQFFFNIAACLFSAFIYITPDNFPADKEGPPPFSSDSCFVILKTTIVNLMQGVNNRISWGSVIIYLNRPVSWHNFTIAYPYHVILWCLKRKRSNINCSCF